MRLSNDIIQQIRTIRVKRLLAEMPPIEHIDYDLNAQKVAEGNEKQSLMCSNVEARRILWIG
jgi:hypothetical protein